MPASARVRHTVAALGHAFEHATRYVESLEESPIRPSVGVAELRARLGGPLPEVGRDPLDVVERLVQATAGGHLRSGSGRFFAWVIGGALPSALAADWLTSVWDQNAVLYACGPAAAVVEEVAGAWMLELLDLPREASFAFTTGCQLAHVTCLAAARFAVLERAGWDVHAAGLCGAPPIRVIVGEHAHATLDRACRLLGIGRRHIEVVHVDADGSISPAAFEAALDRSSGPVIAVLGAADLHAGAFDAFAQLIPAARTAGAWVHVDGAFGLFARASRNLRHLTDGIEQADSWAVDAHKWLNTPFDSGLAVVRDVSAHRQSMTTNASYIAAGRDVRDPIDFTPEWSRRARGFAIHAALCELGRTGVEELVDRSCAHARSLVEGLRALPGVEVLRAPTLNQGLVRFLDRRDGATEAEHDAVTEATMMAINETGEAFFSPTTWRGRRAMRISVVNWRTTERDVERTLAAIASVLRRPGGAG